MAKEYYQKNIGTTDEGEPIIKFISIPDWATEVQAILDADVPIDDHLDVALELE